MSIDFNGTTSQLYNGTASVLGGSKQMTLCVWAYAESQGESNFGRLLSLDRATGTGSFLASFYNVGERMRLYKSCAVTSGLWNFPFTYNQWHALSISYDFSDDANIPVVRVDYADVSLTTVTTPVDADADPAANYGVGNNNVASTTWNGQIAYLRVYNTILSNDDADLALKYQPNQVTDGLRLQLDMTTATDVTDQTANGFDGTPANLATSANNPNILTQTVATEAAVPGVTKKVSRIDWSFAETPVLGNLLVESPSGTTIFELDLATSGEDHVEFPSGLPGADGQAVIASIESTVANTLNVSYM